MAIVSTAGRILDVTGAIDSGIYVLHAIQNENVTWVEGADFGISIGSLFVKSNVAGLIISGGWLIIKGSDILN